MGSLKKFKDSVCIYIVSAADMPEVPERADEKCVLQRKRISTVYFLVAVLAYFITY